MMIRKIAIWVNPIEEVWEELKKRAGKLTVIKPLQINLERDKYRYTNCHWQ